ncbi:cobalamin-binding protein [Thalassotalea ponticola]|uniref:cobalamin-binding protein n=1 Tax=Thalassotalea ponticola TaxID=1523392 RepID=UPI0025B3A217|nr:cobalamin-binding protein [Thalassotalea ponticola]MDN3652215.1 cobalamin-binding protein [Thalassotalea ponticola]
MAIRSFPYMLPLTSRITQSNKPSWLRLRTGFASSMYQLTGLCSIALILAMQMAVAMPSVSSSELDATSSEPSTTLPQQDKTTDKRIVALAPHIVEMLHEIGAYDHIIATSEHADYPLQAKQLPRVGNYLALDIERILQLQPDLVIAWQSGVPINDLARLQSLGIDVLFSNPTQLSDVADELRWLGQLTGHQSLANRKAALFEKQLSQLTKHYQNRPRVSVFYQLWAHPLTTVAKDAWSQQQLDICGAYNPFNSATSQYPQINIEQVLLANPDVIIVPQSQSVTSDGFDWSKYPSITAVVQQQYIHPNADALHRMSYRLIDELAMLCERIDAFRQ